jgi:hypothetical protein
MGVLPISPARGQGGNTGPKHITPDAVKAIEKGLAYLVRTQARDGSWRTQGGIGEFPTSMTSLASLAILASGSTTTQGPHAESLDRATRFLLESARPGGLITRKEEESRSMYGHGFSMLFLGELIGMEESPEKLNDLHRVLNAAIELTSRSQSALGGWLYTPDSRGDEGSVTITQVQGLRACRNAGLFVPKSTIDQALGYLDKSMLPDGGIAYRVGQSRSRPPITAAAVACWFNAGLYQHPNAVRALAFSKRAIGNDLNPAGATSGHAFYAHLYMAQIMFLSGDDNWNWYFPEIRDQLLQRQEEDGSWMGDYIGQTYGTAIALNILQLPYKMLPIMQR